VIVQDFETYKNKNMAKKRGVVKLEGSTAVIAIFNTLCLQELSLQRTFVIAFLTVNLRGSVKGSCVLRFFRKGSFR
jgi:hypothetical protein